MGSIEYGRLNFDIERDVKSVAQMHEEAPINWMDNYVPAPQEIIERIEYLCSKKDDAEFYVDTARDSEGNIIGIHWIETIEKRGEKGGHIGSLCVEKSFRGKGIGSKLKERGECWARENGLKFLSTEVFYSNKKMLAFNQKLGFQCRQVKMVKELF